MRTLTALCLPLLLGFALASSGTRGHADSTAPSALRRIPAGRRGHLMGEQKGLGAHRTLLGAHRTLLLRGGGSEAPADEYDDDYFLVPPFSPSHVRARMLFGDR